MGRRLMTPTVVELFPTKRALPSSGLGVVGFPPKRAITPWVYGGCSNMDPLSPLGFSVGSCCGHGGSGASPPMAFLMLANRS